MLPVKWQKYHSGRGLFHKEMGTKGQAILCKWQNVKLIDWYENNVTSQVPKIPLSKRHFLIRNRGILSLISGKCQNVKSNEKKSFRMGKNIDQMAKIASS